MILDAGRHDGNRGAASQAKTWRMEFVQVYHSTFQKSDQRSRERNRRPESLGSGHGSVLMTVNLKTGFPKSMVQERDLILVVGQVKIGAWFGDFGIVTMFALLPTTRLKMHLLGGVFWRSWTQEVILAYQLCHNRAYLSPLSPLSQHKVRQARWRSEWRGLPLHPQTQNVFIFASPIETHGAFVGIVFSTWPPATILRDFSSHLFYPPLFPSPLLRSPLLRGIALSSTSHRRHSPAPSPPTGNDDIMSDKLTRCVLTPSGFACSNRRAKCSSVSPLSIATRCVRDPLPPRLLCDTPELG